MSSCKKYHCIIKDISGYKNGPYNFFHIYKRLQNQAWLSNIASSYTNRNWEMQKAAIFCRIFLAASPPNPHTEPRRPLIRRELLSRRSVRARSAPVFDNLTESRGTSAIVCIVHRSGRVIRSISRIHSPIVIVPLGNNGGPFSPPPARSVNGLNSVFRAIMQVDLFLTGMR